MNRPEPIVIEQRGLCTHSWWLTAPRAGFCARCYTEWLTRQRFSRSSQVSPTAKDVSKKTRSAGLDMGVE